MLQYGLTLFLIIFGDATYGFIIYVLSMQKIPEKK